MKEVFPLGEIYFQIMPSFFILSLCYKCLFLPALWPLSRTDQLHFHMHFLYSKSYTSFHTNGLTYLKILSMFSFENMSFPIHSGKPSLLSLTTEHRPAARQ